jgi:hypothetical protein
MRKLVSIFGGVLGLSILLAYLNFAFGWVMLSGRLSLVLAFAIGPVAVFGTLALSENLMRVYGTSTLRLGTQFLVIAFVLLTLMLTMQQAIFTEYQRLLEATAEPEALALLEMSFALVNQIQLGADVAFDIFYSLGIIFVSSVLVRSKGLERLIGAYGVLVGTGLLVLNLWFFPMPPAVAGSVDLGPATIVWWVALIVLDGQLNKREASDHA